MTTKDISNVKRKDKQPIDIKAVAEEDIDDENYIIKIRTIAQLMDLYDDTLDIKPNILRNKIQEKIQRMISELSELSDGRKIELTAV